MPEHYIEGRLKGVAKKYAFQLSLFSSIFIGEQTHPDDNHVIRRGECDVISSGWDIFVISSG